MWNEGKNDRTKPQYKPAFRGVLVRVLQKNKMNRMFIKRKKALL